MKRPIQELKTVVDSLGFPPILCAGDIFDKWNTPPELINFAIRELPVMFAVPGQHDLPYHRYEDLKKSAFWTLVEADKLILVEGGQTGGKLQNVRVHGFPWGKELTYLEDPHDLLVEVALVHRYVWINGHQYPGAPEEAKLGSYRKDLAGYDVAVFGDNHKGFIVQSKENRCGIINNGTFLRRKSDEFDYKPFLGLIYSDGTVDRHYLSIDSDVLVETGGQRQEMLEGSEELLQELLNLGDSALDFTEAIKQYADRNGISPQVREIILKAMEGG